MENPALTDKFAKAANAPVPFKACFCAVLLASIPTTTRTIAAPVTKYAPPTNVAPLAFVCQEPVLLQNVGEAASTWTPTPVIVAPVTKPAQALALKANADANLAQQYVVHNASTSRPTSTTAELVAGVALPAGFAPTEDVEPAA